MWLGLNWYFGYGAFISPPIFKNNNYCYLAFYYKLRDRGKASLSLFIEESNGNKSTSLWSTADPMMQWKKKVITLPQTSFNYSIVFLGYYKSYGYVFIDDMEFVQCGQCKL